MNLKDNSYKRINIINDNENIFDDKFIIPVYQRSYDWKKNDIDTFIDNIFNCDNKKYHLGVIVLKNTKNGYEIIDGQQRLTTLYIIFKTLNVNIRGDLKYIYDKDNNEIIHNISIILEDSNKYNGSIVDNIKFIKEKIDELLKSADKNIFIKKLKSVDVVLTTLPKNTDIIDYFVKMNTRSLQLTNVDIIKSRLMNSIKSDKSHKEKELKFIKIWNACANINSYIKDNFSEKERNSIFSEYGLKVSNWQELFDCLNVDVTDYNYDTIGNILASNNKNVNYESNNKNKENDVSQSSVKYESIIGFDYFLSHALKVYFINNLNESKDSFNLDTQNLIANYEELFKRKSDNTEFALEYIYYLLKLRTVFDYNIIKRNNEDGKWCIENEKLDEKNEVLLQNIVLLQSLLRVSYTQAKSMRWITDLLKDLMKDSIDYSDYQSQIINYIRKYINDILDKENDDYFHTGTDIHRLVFNYIDYLLLNDPENDAKIRGFVRDSFRFEFRNSVEHFYPQNPKNKNKKMENKSLNYIGNLCLVTKKFNSTLSNELPTEKIDEKVFKKENISPKLWMMRNIINDYENGDKNDYWKNEGSKNHGEDIIRILEEDLKKMK